MLEVTCYKFQISFMNQSHPSENREKIKSVCVLGLMWLSPGCRYFASKVSTVIYIYSAYLSRIVGVKDNHLSPKNSFEEYECKRLTSKQTYLYVAEIEVFVSS